MSRYVVFGVKPWCDDYILGEFDNREDAYKFELEQKEINKSTDQYSYITSKVYLDN